MVKVLGFWGSRFKAQGQGASGGFGGACQRRIGRWGWPARDAARCAESQFKKNCLAEMWSVSMEGSYSRLIDCRITQL